MAAWIRRSSIFAPVMREAPQDAPLASQRLLLRAGFVRKGEGAGLFVLLPLGMRVMSKISQIVDEGMASISAQRTSMPSLMSSQPWQTSGRSGRLALACLSPSLANAPTSAEACVPRPRSRVGTAQGPSSFGCGIAVRASKACQPFAGSPPFTKLAVSRYCLAPTHEEIFTSTVAAEVTSFKQLPLRLYQIGPKFRDEIRSAVAGFVRRGD